MADQSVTSNPDSREFDSHPPAFEFEKDVGYRFMRFWLHVEYAEFLKKYEGQVAEAASINALYECTLRVANRMVDCGLIDELSI